MRRRGGGVRVPARRGAGGPVERGDAVRGLAADRGEVAADVDGRAGDGSAWTSSHSGSSCRGRWSGEGGDRLRASRRSSRSRRRRRRSSRRRQRVTCRWARVPAVAARGRVEGGEVAGLAADRGEAAADVDGRAGDGEGLDAHVGVPSAFGLEARVDAAVGEDVGEVVSRDAADVGEVSRRCRSRPTRRAPRRHYLSIRPRPAADPRFCRSWSRSPPRDRCGGRPG